MNTICRECDRYNCVCVGVSKRIALSHFNLYVNRESLREPIREPLREISDSDYDYQHISNPVNNKTISKLDRKQEEKEYNICSICKVENSEVIKLRCSHLFHKECILK